MDSRYIPYLSDEGAEKLLGEIIAVLDREEKVNPHHNDYFTETPWRELLEYTPTGSIKEQLETLICILDDKDGEDYFGTWGWRAYFGFGD